MFSLDAYNVHYCLKPKPPPWGMGLEYLSQILRKLHVQKMF